MNNSRSEYEFCLTVKEDMSDGYARIKGYF